MACTLVDLVKRLDTIDDNFQIRRRAVDGIAPHTTEVGPAVGTASRVARLLRHDCGAKNRADDARTQECPHALPPAIEDPL